jgi:hypothetical protein
VHEQDYVLAGLSRFSLPAVVAAESFPTPSKQKVRTMSKKRTLPDMIKNLPDWLRLHRRKLRGQIIGGRIRAEDL